jgi:hypothetical protein
VEGWKEQIKSHKKERIFSLSQNLDEAV